MARIEPISINGNSLDPSAPAIRAAGLGTSDASKSKYILVQTDKALTKDYKDELKGKKVNVKERVGQSTYLCRYEPDDLKDVRGLGFVKWAADYPINFVVAANLKPGSSESALSSQTVLSTHPHTVDVVFHKDYTKTAEELKKEVASAAHIDPEALAGDELDDEKVRITVQGRYLDAIANIDEVQSIVEVRANKLFNNIARNILLGRGGVPEPNDITVDGVTYRGQGEIVAVADTGVDSDHPAFKGRIKKTFDLGRPGSTNDIDGHGTHVCGSVLGNAENSDGDIIQGTAPESQLVMQAIGDRGGGLGGIPPRLGPLFRQAYDEGARVHSNSWGDSVPAQPYEQSATEIDRFVKQNPDLTIVFAAGNDGLDSDRDGVADLQQIGSQAAAKNCITVGASENLRPDLTLEYGFEGFSTASGALKFGASPIRFDKLANNLEGLAAFSSRGPTQESRIKPDVVAPGTGILSARSSLVTDSGLFGQSNDPQWKFEAGTSMATPLVSGCAAVIRQALRKNPPDNAPSLFPSAALVKAVMINGTVDLAGQYLPSEAGPSPNFNSGWGRVNLTDSVNAVLASQYVEGGALDDDASKDFDIEIPESGSTLKVTLVWTDEPGPFLQNDLDLSVTVGTTTRRGNSGINRANNVEQVTWTNIPKGSAKVNVSVLTLTEGPQDYAVAWRIL